MGTTIKYKLNEVAADLGMDIKDISEIIGLAFDKPKSASTVLSVEQLNLAQRAGDGDFYEMSAIDSRLRELKQRLVEEAKEKRNWQ